MAFYYVDRITELRPGQSIVGFKKLTHNERFYYTLPGGSVVASPALVTEALAQAGAWLKMHDCDFVKRPVLLSDEYTEYLRPVRIGETLELRVRLTDRDDDVISSHGEAWVNGECVARSHHCRGFMLPIEQFEERSAVIQRFNAVFRAEDSIQSFRDYRLPRASQVLLSGVSFVDGILSNELYRKVEGFKHFSLTEDYFATHFPAKPVVPGVLLMTFMGELVQQLNPEMVFLPTSMKNMRFRKFVEPGDSVRGVIECTGGDARIAQQQIEVRAQLYVGKNRVMNGEAGFLTMNQGI